MEKVRDFEELCQRKGQTSERYIRHKRIEEIQGSEWMVKKYS